LDICKDLTELNLQILCEEYLENITQKERFCWKI